MSLIKTALYELLNRKKISSRHKTPSDSSRLGTEKNLVVVRTKNPVNVKKWRLNSKNWDLLVLDYSTDGSVNFSGENIVRQNNQSLRKYDGIEAATPLDYDYYMLIDDDLELVDGSIDLAFEIAARENFWICQPSLSTDSACSWWITYNFKSFSFREVSFVEVMAPILAREAFLEARPLFSRLPVGWGLDIWWSKLAETRGKKLGVIDDVVFRHARPLGTGDGYEGYPQEQARNIMNEFLRENDLSFNVSLGIHGGQLKNGDRTLHNTLLAFLFDMHDYGLLKNSPCEPSLSFCRNA